MLPRADHKLERLCSDTFHFLLILLLPGCEGGAEDERNFLLLRSWGEADPGWRRLWPVELGRRKSCFLWNHPRGGTEGCVGSQLIVAEVTICFLNMKITTPITCWERGGNWRKDFLCHREKGLHWPRKVTWHSQPWNPEPRHPGCLALP